MKFAIIGAGSSGLAALKYCLEHGHECDAFEQTGNIGGIWYYTDLVDVDKDGISIHTSMYKDLITNFPKELMTYADFSYPEDKIESYISQKEVLDYIHSYANNFDLKKHIQMYKEVTNIEPDGNEKWFVTIKDSKTLSEQTLHYDAVLICNGRFHQPIFPKIVGQSVFDGLQIHSRNFRTADAFKNKTVLIVGGSYSGQELCLKIAEVAKQVYLSYRETKMYIEFPKNLTPKPEVAKFSKNGATFIDDTYSTFDCVLYCTGFEYVCPFVSEKCGVTIQDNFVRPLYKQIINVQHPTMCFIGIPYVSIGIPMFDMQVRFALAAIEQKFKVPTKEEMLKELEEFIKNKRSKSIPDSKFHKLGGPDQQKEYLQELSDVSGIPQLRPVVYKLYHKIKECFKRSCSFKIVDDDNFTETCL